MVAAHHTTSRYAQGVHTGILALLGSGETAPGMTKVHRELLARNPEGVAVNLDTPYGFQENVPQMTEKLIHYFDVSLHRVLEPVSLRNFEDASPLERTIVKQRVREAAYVFSGPGSPTYALKQWRALDLVNDLAAVLENNGVLCFSSAATLTLGAYTAPIYEVYKVGEPPRWLEGLNLTRRLGLECVVIPHFDNHEGANYDTRYCYLGQRRLELLESQLPESVATLGIDEHTALLLDLATDQARVIGRGNAYWRHRGDVITISPNEPMALATLRSFEPAPPDTVATPRESASEPHVLASLIARGDDASGEALARLARLAEGSTTNGVATPQLIDAVLAVRDVARSTRQFELADQLRDALTVAGVIITDTPTGSSWTIESS